MFDSSDEEEAEKQFDAVDRYAEPDEPSAEDLGPEIPEAPEAPDPSDVDVDSDLLVSFWGLVVVFNVALLATSVGLLFVIFDGNLDLGGRLTVAGLAVFAYGLFRYRRAKRTVVAEVAGSDDEPASVDRDGDPADQNG